MLKYLIASANATAQLLLTSEIEKVSADRRAQGRKGVAHTNMFKDIVNARGDAGSNGIPDVLDKGRWGLEWMLKLHPTPDALYHQVADDRDHCGPRMPYAEIADYGWGWGSNRVVYCADGKPQGLGKYKSTATGVANLAGRYAAAMALGQIAFKKIDPAFGQRCLKAGVEVYALGQAKEGAQQGNSYKEPYRYEETTWADDMEWGAAALYRVTRERHYLEEAKSYAKLAASESWMGQEQTKHYQYYPFMNAGHFMLYDLVGPRDPATPRPILPRRHRAAASAWARRIPTAPECHSSGARTT